MISKHAVERYCERIIGRKYKEDEIQHNYYKISMDINRYFQSSELVYEGSLGKEIEDNGLVKIKINGSIIFVIRKDSIVTILASDLIGKERDNRIKETRRIQNRLINIKKVLERKGRECDSLELANKITGYKFQDEYKKIKNQMSIISKDNKYFKEKHLLLIKSIIYNNEYDYIDNIFFEKKLI